MVSLWHNENLWLPEKQQALLVEIPCALPNIPLHTAPLQQRVALNSNTTSILAVSNGFDWFGTVLSNRPSTAISWCDERTPVNRCSLQRGL